MQTPNDPMAAIRASFFVECGELIEALHDALASLAYGETDPETVNVVFRAVHSIKGGAGAFGLTALVAFAHRYETVMDAVRAGRLAPDPDLVRGLIRAADMLADQVAAAQNGSPEPDQAQAVLAALEAFLGADAAPPDDAHAAVAFQPLGLSFDLDFGDLEEPPAADEPAIPPSPAPAVGAAAETGGMTGWSIRFRPTAALYASGNEPLMLLRALATLGPITVRCETAELPVFDLLDAEDSYLCWNVTLLTEATEAEIEDVFDFVDDLAEIALRRADTVEGVPDGGADAAPGSAPRTLPRILPPALPVGPGAEPQPVLPVTAQTPPPLPLPLPLPPPMPGRQPSAGPMHPADDIAGRAAGPAAPVVEPQAEPPATTVRVDLDRVDRLVNLAGELVINQAMIVQSVTEAGLSANSAVMSGLDALMLLTRDIQDSVMMIRAQPVKPLFQRMARIVREASQAVGKEVRLVCHGEATEIDKTVIERLADPLTHMIRNAVDHGLEPAATRIVAGKPAAGTVTLTAQHRSGRVVIDVADDGGGIDRERVLATAIRKGLIAADAVPAESEIDALLFLPGFSTAATVSSLSGRGVGMDVVKRAIQALGGRIAITSERGRGTRLSISLPLTLAVLDGMVIRVAGQTVVMPLSAIVETATLSQADMRSIGSGSVVTYLRGTVMPLLDLGVALGFRAPLASYDQAVALIITQDDASRTAFVVDGIVEQRQVVIKGLERTYGRVPGVSAATILGNGQVALILDPADILRQAVRQPTIRSIESAPLSLAG